MLVNNKINHFDITIKKKNNIINTCWHKKSITLGTIINYCSNHMKFNVISNMSSRHYGSQIICDRQIRHILFTVLIKEYVSI